MALVAFTGCARQSALEQLNTTPPQEYRGHYTRGSNGSWFKPCNAAPADSAWWVTVTGIAVSQLDSARTRGLFTEERATFVHWRAVLTRGGEVGPPGATALLVRDILVVRPAAAGDCATG